MNVKIWPIFELILEFIAIMLTHFFNQDPVKIDVTIGMTYSKLNRGIKHDFPFINIRKVPREVLKTEGEAGGLQLSLGTLRMLMTDKIMFNRYYCIKSTKTLRTYWCTIFYNLIKFIYTSTLWMIRAEVKYS